MVKIKFIFYYEKIISLNFQETEGIKINYVKKHSGYDLAPCLFKQLVSEMLHRLQFSEFTAFIPRDQFYCHVLAANICTKNACYWLNLDICLVWKQTYLEICTSLNSQQVFSNGCTTAVAAVNLNKPTIHQISIGFQKRKSSYRNPTAACRVPAFKASVL